MASDRQEYREASWKWNDLSKRRLFSVAPDIGTTAIFVSSWTDPELDHAEAEAQRAAFREEAKQVAERIRGQGHSAGIVRSSVSMFASMIKNRRICSIITIGHGRLGQFSTDEPEHAGVNWKVLSEYTDHLKTGVFIQRQCGNRADDLNVPLGLFVMNNPRNIHAADGVVFPDTVLDPEDEAKIKPLFEDDSLPGYRGLKSQFPKDEMEGVRIVPKTVVAPVAPLPF